MKRMEIIFIITVIILSALLAYGWYLNRASDFITEKLLPVMVIGLIGSLFTLWFGLKEESIEETIPVCLMYDNTSGESLEKHDAKYDHFFGSKSYQIRRYVKYSSQANSDEFGTYKLFYPMDVIFLETLTLLFSACEQGESGLIGPHVSPHYDPSGLGGLYIYDPKVSSSFVNLPKEDLRIYAFTSNFKNFSDEAKELYMQLEEKGIIELFHLNEMYVPKGSKIKAECSRTKRNIHLKNSFCEINVEVIFSGGHADLNKDWKHILGYATEKSKQFQTGETAMLFSAKFNRFLSGHPDMPKYKNWVNALITRLEQNLDSERKLKYAREQYLLYKDDINSYINAQEKKEAEDKAQEKGISVIDPNS